MKILKIVRERSKQLYCFKRTKEAIFIEEIHSFVQHCVANFLQKHWSLIDDCSMFYTGNTMHHHFVVGSIVDENDQPSDVPYDLPLRSR